MNRVASPPGPDQARILVGLIGRDILASRSPWMHEGEADALGLRMVYSLFDFAVRGWTEADLPRLLDAAERIGFAGLNVTYPYKQAVIPLLDELSEGARRVGAVNTIAFTAGRRIGHNTDVTGFAENLANGLAGAQMAEVVQCGAGGAGSATATALLEAGVRRLTLVDTDASRTATLVTRLAAEFGEGRVSTTTDLEAAIARMDGFVNATPVGMEKSPGTPIPTALLQPHQWFADIVYFPLETQLLADAARKGCRTLDGSGMAVSQAASAFEIFTGLTADRSRMQRRFVAFVHSCSGASDWPRTD